MIAGNVSILNLITQIQSDNKILLPNVLAREAYGQEETYRYEPEPEETLVHSDDVAVILVYRDGRPIKIIYPNGRVEPFTGRDIPN